ncbi:MAG: SBBP repeat-containing protein, partial [Candidatus Odinarchaeota archaeon]
MFCIRNSNRPALPSAKTIIVYTLLLSSVFVFSQQTKSDLSSTAEDYRGKFFFDDLPLYSNEFPSKHLNNQQTSDFSGKDIPFTGFIENKGQVVDDRVRYCYSTKDSAIRFVPSGLILTDTVGMREESITFEMTFKGANSVNPESIGRLSHKTNYFKGEKKFMDIASWQEILYHDLYENIDLHYYMTGKGLKYEFIIRPGGNPDQIAILISENMDLRVSDGSVVLHPSDKPAERVLEDTELLTYQEDGSVITSRFSHLNGTGNGYSFELESYNASQTLIIDPLWLEFSTYYGGSGGSGQGTHNGEGNEKGNGIAIDSSGNVYVTGETRSSDIPTDNGYDTDYNLGLSDAFIFKLNSTGNGLEYGTYIGGNDWEEGTGIVVDSFGYVYVTGNTRSTDFPRSNAIQQYLAGDEDAFLLKLDKDGDALLFSTYFGGNYFDYCCDIERDGNGQLYICGKTKSTNLSTTTGAYQESNGADDVDYFIAKFNSDASTLLKCTYLGGTGYEWECRMAVDISENIYIAGFTQSGDFPRVNAYQDSHMGSMFDSTISKLKADFTSLLYSTYLGGTGYDVTKDIAIDSGGNAYITGYTTSEDHPTENPYQDQLNSTGKNDIFLVKLNATGNGLVYGTYIGGSKDDYGTGIDKDSSGNIYVTGYTESTNFPINDSYKALSGLTGAFLLKMNSTGNGMIYSTVLPNSSWAYDVVIDNSGYAYITGETGSIYFPTVNPFQATSNGYVETFVTKFSAVSDNNLPEVQLLSPENNTVQKSGTTIDINVTDTLSGVKQVVYNWDDQSNTTLLDPYDLAVISEEIEHVLEVYAEDVAGNWVYEKYVFTTDDSAPVVIVDTGIVDNYYLPGEVLSCEVTESSSGLLTVKYLWGGASDLGVQASGTDWPAPYDTVLPATDGPHYLWVYVEDSLGNDHVYSFKF